MTQSCKTCAHGEFNRTPTGKISKVYTSAKCTAPMPQVVAPASVEVRLYRNGIWPDFGTECAAYLKRA